MGSRVQILFSLLLGLVAPAHIAAQANLTAEDVIARHLDSIAPQSTRQSMKSRVSEGTVEFRILVGGSGVIDGKTALVSEGKKLHFMMKLPNGDYHGERLVTDGSRVEIFTATQQARSIFGEFVRSQDAPVREGLMGGVLSTAWPLSHLDERKAKVVFAGLKNLDGQQVYELQYKPKKSGDLHISLYFDSTTFHHVRSVYWLSVRPSIVNVPASPESAVPMGGEGVALPSGNTETASARQHEAVYRIEERFSDFKPVDGFTLPSHYDLRYSEELQNGRTTSWEWDMKETQISNNVSLDPRNFEIK